MRLKLLFDMNLTPRFAEFFRQRGADAQHWSALGNPDASDQEIMEYATENGYVVVTLDLDFSAILAATQALSPSVVQIRSKEAITETAFKSAYSAIGQVEDGLISGAILTIDMERSRLRMLPLSREDSRP
jgi:predicted nuclease of predicted toxin-antitoxin system